MTTKKDGKVPGASERKFHFAHWLIQTQDMISVNFPVVISGFQLSCLMRQPSSVSSVKGLEDGSYVQNWAKAVKRGQWLLRPEERGRWLDE